MIRVGQALVTRPLQRRMRGVDAARCRSYQSTVVSWWQFFPNDSPTRGKSEMPGHQAGADRQVGSPGFLWATGAGSGALRRPFHQSKGAYRPSGRRSPGLSNSSWRGSISPLRNGFIQGKYSAGHVGAWARSPRLRSGDGWPSQNDSGSARCWPVENSPGGDSLCRGRKRSRRVAPSRNTTAAGEFHGSQEQGGGHHRSRLGHRGGDGPGVPGGGGPGGRRGPEPGAGPHVSRAPIDRSCAASSAMWRTKARPGLRGRGDWRRSGGST